MNIGLPMCVIWDNNLTILPSYKYRITPGMSTAAVTARPHNREEHYLERKQTLPAKLNATINNTL